MLDRKISDLLAMLRPHLAKRDDSAWPLAPAADVLSADVAIVQAPECDRGWDLRWVEFQAFTSAVATAYTLHCASEEIWPELSDLRFWNVLPHRSAWVEATQRWMAPQPGSILLDNEPWSQATRYDFEPAQRWFNLAIVDPRQLRSRSGRLERLSEEGEWLDVPHVANRLILHEAPSRAAIEDILSSVSLSWNSHPVWYYRVSKALMPKLSLSPSERCVSADHWRDLGIPAEELVAKPKIGYAGNGVLLNVDADALDSLAVPADWIVQPRYHPVPLIKANDGSPLCTELRCVVALPQREGEFPWVVSRFARMARGTMASARFRTGGSGEGLVPVYAPPLE